MKRIFENKKAVAILRNDFEVNDAYAQPAMFSESIFACFDTQCRRSISRWLQGFIHGAPSWLFDVEFVASHR